MGDDHHGHDRSDSGTNPHDTHDESRESTELAHALPPGLSVASNGLRLEPSTTRLDPGIDQEWTYRLMDRSGDVVTDFEETHEQLAHLILVRRDLTRFQHLHPLLDESGTRSSEFVLPDPGVYRAFVDVLLDGHPTTLGVDLFASGSADYENRLGSTREASAEGYGVTMTPKSVP